MQQGFMAERLILYQQFAAGSIDAATALTTPAGTEFVEVIPSAQAIRWRADGTNPTTVVGMPIAVGVTKIFTMQQISAIKVISQVAGAVLDVTYYGR